MGCNCGKNKTRPFSPASMTQQSTAEPTKFVLRTRLGQTSFNSRLEAEAAKRRAGGGQIIEVR